MRHTIEVIDAAAAASVVLHPLRRRILEHVRETADSAAGVARALGLPRQRVSYHVRELERAGLVEAVDERRRGNCVERRVRASATHYLIAPAVLGGVAAGGQVRDRFSSSYLLAVAAQTIRDVTELRKGAAEAGRSLPTISLQTEIRFSSAASQHEFAEALAGAVARLTAKYHDEAAAGGRYFRFQLVGYPRPARPAGSGTEGGGSV